MHVHILVFTMTLSAVSDLKGNGDHVGTWLDTEVFVRGQQLLIMPKNANREWLYGNALRSKRAIVRWPGRPPGGFSRSFGMLLARVHRSRELKLESLTMAIYPGRGP